MKISLNWLRDFVEIPSDLSPREFGEKFTIHTAEVEGIESQQEEYENMIIGEVKEMVKHPGADKLSLCQVDIGETQNAQLVCGGQNLQVGMKVAVAKPGAWVRWHGEGEPVELSEAKIRGEKSFGMICAGEEIGLETDNPEGQKEVRIKDLSHLNTTPGTPLAEALNKNDLILDIDNKSLTNRPDLWGHYGIAREVSAIFNTPLKPLDDKLHYDQGTPTETFNVTIEDNEGCPRFSGCIVKNVRVTESPQWMKTRLQAAGIRPISNLVDITNYVMLELGAPMHAYDRQVVGSDELIVRRAKKGEKLETIDHKKRDLFEEDVIVTNAQGTPLGLGGVMGGAGSEINDNTTEVIFEAANWNPVMIRKMSTRHALRSDASQRFEKGLDPALTEQAVARALVLLKETCPDAELVTPLTTTGTWKEQPLSIILDPKVALSKIGTDIEVEEIARILTALEFDVNADGHNLDVTVPSHRATGDVSIPEDLVEEIARIHGYDKIDPILPELPAKLPRENQERKLKHIGRQILAHDLGFSELMNYSFYNENMFKQCGLQDIRHIEVANPLSAEQTHMRVSLIPGILQSLERNGMNYDDMKCFEFGHTYREQGEFMPLEEKWLAATIATKQEGEVFFDIKGAFQDFVDLFRPGKIQLRDCHTPPTYAHPKKCLEIMMRGEAIGYLFTLHPATAQTFGIEHNVGIFELNFTKLAAHGRQLADFTPLPKYPSMNFDVAVLVDAKTPVADLEKTIKKSDKQKLIQSIELFDLYKGDKIPAGKKSLAFNVTLRSDDHTLTDQEFQTAHKAVLAALEKAGGEVRGN